jgi:hypothetical protein
MTDQHRATPEQWEKVEEWATRQTPLTLESCVIELRARVEALEAAQRPSPSPAPADLLVERVQSAIDNAPPDTYREARAAIREVAAWLESLPPSFLSQEELKEAAFLIRKEAYR